MPGCDRRLDQLSSLTGITVSKNQDGTVSVLTGGQQAVVIAIKLYASVRIPPQRPRNQVSHRRWQLAGPIFRPVWGALLDFRNGTLQDLLGANGYRRVP